MAEKAPALENQRQKTYFRRILHFISPESGYVFVLNQRPFELKRKLEDGHTTRYEFQEIVQLPEPENLPIQEQYSEEALLDLLVNEKAHSLDPESGHEYLAQRLGAEKLQVGDEITVTATGTRRRVTEILGSLGGIRTEKIISTPKGEIAQPETKPWDMNSVVTGLRSGKITVKRPKKQQPVG